MNPAALRYGAAAIGALALIALPFGLSAYGNYVLSLWALTTIAAIGLNLTFGHAGQVSLGQGAFVGIGAYLTALVTTRGWSFPAAYVVAFAACFACGWGLGYPALRVRRPYLPFLTLAFATFVFLVFRNEEWLTGGVYGINRVPRPDVPGLPTAGPLGFCYFCLLNLAVVSAAVWWLVRSPWGRAFAALRANPLRAEAVGIDTRRYVLIAVALGAGLGGVAGVLYAALLQYVEPSPFSLTMSVSLLLMVAMGGSGRLLGPFLGAAAAVVLPEGMRFAQNYYLFGYALAVVLLMAFCPTGLIGLGERLVTALTKPHAAPAKAAP
ncbi:MAG TPA: branched-chain amino acid ABC transporter permease [Xanthobacteraceae bacterium]|jgi:branched-chain amino acid transport system permease protein|nr:branched-chain amino acid ABC transporter permease [Xanthobacteraceae bacterium]